MMNKILGSNPVLYQGANKVGQNFIRFLQLVQVRISIKAIAPIIAIQDRNSLSTSS